MVAGRDEAQARALFEERYRSTPSRLTRQIEPRVIGGDWGANGFTTMDQADTLARELQLSAARLEPPGAFAQRQADRHSMLAAIRAGLLRRALLLARTA
jgi:hypothetical protein